MSRALEITTTMLQLIREVKDTYHANYDDIGERDLETQDFLHEIEMGKLNALQRLRVFRELRKVRIDRRQMKNENEALRVLFDLFNRMSKLETELSKAQEQIKRIEQKQEASCYSPRVRTDLTIGKPLEDLKEKLESNNAG